MAKIGIIGAMELEVDALKAAMEVKNTGILWESFHRWESGNLSQMKLW